MRRSPYDMEPTIVSRRPASRRRQRNETYRKPHESVGLQVPRRQSGVFFDDYNEETTLGSYLSPAMEFANQVADRVAETFNLDESYSRWIVIIAIIVLILAILLNGRNNSTVEDGDIRRPQFVYHHPYVTSSYYTSTQSRKTLLDTERLQVKGRKTRQTQTRLAIVRPFCEFDAEGLPSTFAVWNQFAPCKAAAAALGIFDDDYEEDHATTDFEKEFFDEVPADVQKKVAADVFLFYSQTFSENDVAVQSCDAIIDQFNEPGGWSQCFDNVYAIEANIPKELDLYIPSAQEELYNWVNGPNRQFEAAVRIIQSGEWGEYDGFYLMEGDSIPIKNHWLDVILSEVEENRPFAILGAKYNGDKWNTFYESIPLSLLEHTNGNAIYNTSHPLLERLVGQLEVEAPCPYNSIPYDYRMSQMITEGRYGIVPELAPKIMLNEEGENITLSENTAMFTKWWEVWEDEDPFKETPAIHNYAATNLIPRHLGPEYVIHGAKLYSPWNPVKTEITLVVSEWFNDRSKYLIETLDQKDHPFSEVVVMLPADVEAHDDYDNMTVIPTRTQHREAPDYMDLCEVEIDTDWFMWTNGYHKVSRFVDLMFVPGKNKPVIPFTPATYPFCFKFQYCKETVNLAQRFNPGHDKVVQDFDMLYHTATRDEFCKEWKERFGIEGEDLYKNRRRRRPGKVIGPPGPTGTSYAAYLFREGLDSKYKFTDRSLYGARDPFVKVFAREEKLDGMSDEERALMDLLGYGNITDCDCTKLDEEDECLNNTLGCEWQYGFNKCRPPKLIDGDPPVCPKTEAPTMAPTTEEERVFYNTDSPTVAPTDAPIQKHWADNLFKVRERERDLQRKREGGRKDDDLGDRKKDEGRAAADEAPLLLSMFDLDQEEDSGPET